MGWDLGFGLAMGGGFEGCCAERRGLGYDWEGMAAGDARVGFMDGRCRGCGGRGAGMGMPGGEDEFGADTIREGGWKVWGSGERIRFSLVLGCWVLSWWVGGYLGGRVWIGLGWIGLDGMGLNWSASWDRREQEEDEKEAWDTGIGQSLTIELTKIQARKRNYDSQSAAEESTYSALFERRILTIDEANLLSSRKVYAVRTGFLDATVTAHRPARALF